MQRVQKTDALNARKEEEEEEGEVNPGPVTAGFSRSRGVQGKEVFLIDRGGRFTSVYGKRALPTEGTVAALDHFERNPEGRLIDYWPVKKNCCLIYFNVFGSSPASVKQRRGGGGWGVPDRGIGFD